MPSLPVVATVQRRTAVLTARAEQTAALAATGESSSTGIELDLISGELEFLVAVGREVVAQRQADLQALSEVLDGTGETQRGPHVATPTSVKALINGPSRPSRPNPSPSN
jgi:hypothetical protein